MALGEDEHCCEMNEDSESDEFQCTDDSDDDPSFDILEETQSAISKLSIKKPKARRCKVVDVNVESEPERAAVGDEISNLDKKEEKSFEKVEQLIKGGHLEKLTLDQCKVYLRKYGLRLTGNKGILISRIREHQEILDDCGEKKYPPESFVLNCKGDACLGDVVIFEQNVYEMFNIASRSATGPPCGTRTVAGRIVKESYGVAKQQHTFTIEVLWSKGVKPLPPLHQLLIKGRNLYRIKTMRQTWIDEVKRLKVLQEKHGRGSRARYSREIRIKEKEKRTTGMVIKRKNLTDDHLRADKENQHPEKAHVQQICHVLIPQQPPQSILVNPSTAEHAIFSVQQICHVLIPQQPPQSILVNPRTAEHAIFSAQPPKSQNLQYIHQAKYHHGFHMRPHQHHQHHYKENHVEFHGSHLHHNNYSHHMNHFIYVPLQQQYSEYQKRQPCHYLSQG